MTATAIGDVTLKPTIELLLRDALCMLWNDKQHAEDKGTALRFYAHCPLIFFRYRLDV